MFRRLKTLIRKRFFPKKISLIPTEEAIVAARETMKGYPLMATSSELQEIARNDFKLQNGAQLQPAKFLDEIITHIEKSATISKEDFTLYMRQKIAAIPPPLKKKRGWRLWQKRS